MQRSKGRGRRGFPTSFQEPRSIVFRRLNSRPERIFVSTCLAYDFDQIHIRYPGYDRWRSGGLAHSGGYSGFRRSLCGIHQRAIGQIRSGGRCWTGRPIVGSHGAGSGVCDTSHVRRSRSGCGIVHHAYRGNGRGL